MNEWLTALEIVELQLPGMPKTKRGVNKLANVEAWHQRINAAGDALTRRRKGQGGGFEFHYSLLPTRAQAKFVQLSKPEAHPSREAVKAQLGRSDAWAHYEQLSDARKGRAIERLEVLDAVLALHKGGATKVAAADMVAADRGLSGRSVFRWLKSVEGFDRLDWLPHLVPRFVGRTKTADCSPEAWEYIKADWLRPEQPTLRACYRRLQRTAKALGWTIPSALALERRIRKEIPEAVITLAREGGDALKQLYPAQERDRSVFHALEAVNADGHKVDVFVKWLNGEIGRPLICAFQDLYSGLILSWRVARSENKEAVRLAFGDVVEQYGIPDEAYMDNGRAFASKWLTGRMANRYRFKIRDEDPEGILITLGVKVHWTEPYAGQSKPIERAFRDVCDNIAKHPDFAGAYTGNNPMAKPENYGNAAIPIDDFIRVFEDGIVEHNTRVGRRAALCRGRSFMATFMDSYEQSPIRQATSEQRRLWLLAAEGVRASREDGSIRMMGNRYWAEFMTAHRGQAMIARFDPQNLQQGIHIYRLDGGYIGFAECWEAVGFNDTDAARRHGQARRSYMAAQKAILAAERRMTIEEVAALLPAIAEPPAMPTPGATRLVHGNTVRVAEAAAGPAASPETETFNENFGRGLRLVSGKE